MILSVPVVLNRAAMIKSVHFQIKIVESYNYLETILDKNWLLSITPVELIRRLSSTSSVLGSLFKSRLIGPS